MSSKPQLDERAVERLTDYRRNIDRIDLQLLALLNERTRVVEKIGQVKQEYQIPVYEPKREDEVFRNVLEHNSGPLTPDAVKRIFERIIDEMRTLQKTRMQK
jgi:chorismate mutase-like protein